MISKENKLVKQYKEKIDLIQSSTEDNRNQLYAILKELFVIKVIDNEQSYTINPSLTLDKILLLEEQTRNIILNLYISCEKYFIQALIIFENIYESKDYTISELRKENLMKIEEQVSPNYKDTLTIPPPFSPDMNQSISEPPQSPESFDQTIESPAFGQPAIAPSESQPAISPPDSQPAIGEPAITPAESQPQTIVSPSPSESIVETKSPQPYQINPPSSPDMNTFKNKEIINQQIVSSEPGPSTFTLDRPQAPITPEPSNKIQTNTISSFQSPPKAFSNSIPTNITQGQVQPEVSQNSKPVTNMQSFPGKSNALEGQSQSPSQPQPPSQPPSQTPSQNQNQPNPSQIPPSQPPSQITPEVSTNKPPEPKFNTK